MGLPSFVAVLPVIVESWMWSVPPKTPIAPPLSAEPPLSVASFNVSVPPEATVMSRKAVLDLRRIFDPLPSMVMLLVAAIGGRPVAPYDRSEEHTSELQSRFGI